MPHTVILVGETQREYARRLIAQAQPGSVVTVDGPKRSTDQNAKMWAMLSDISRAKPEGRMHTPEVWKSLFMSACGHEVQFLMGLDGNPFPAGFKTSKLRKDQMADLITFIQEYGDRHGVRWQDLSE